DCDVVIAGGTVVTPSDMFIADVGITGGRVAVLGLNLRGQRTIDAKGLLVMPGGVDSHCHIEQLQAGGGADEESFVTGSTSALAGGTPASSPSPPNSRAKASSHRLRNIAGGRRRRWSTTPSIRSSP